MDPHIRDFYNLPKDQPVPQWARDNFVEAVGNAGAKSGKVFNWSLRGQDGPQSTFANLYRDPNTKKWLAVQYYADGQRAGEFASAFEPTTEQIDAMLRQNAVM